MKFTALAAAIAASTLPMLAGTAPAAATPTSFVGTWTAPSSSRGVTKVIIAGSGSSYTIHAFGACSPTDCDFGSVPLTTFSSSVSDPNLTDDGGTANFTESFATRTMTINLTKAGKLQVDLFTKFTDNSGRQNYEDKETMSKMLVLVPPHGVGLPPAAEDCISYNNNDLSLRNLGPTGYQLVSGNIALQVLQSESDAEAAKAVAAAHHQQCFIGRNNTESNRYQYIMEYWK